MICTVFHEDLPNIFWWATTIFGMINLKDMRLLLFLLLLLSAGVSAQEKADYVQDENNAWAIDMTVLTVEGKHYAVWSGWDGYYVDCEAPMQWLYIAPMTFHKDKPYVRLGKRALLSAPELPFEMKVDEHISLLEGPSALYHGDDVFILYSCRGSWTVNYKMGQLRLKEGCDPMDPASWEKKGEAVFEGLYEEDQAGYLVGGVGHASFTTSPDGKENWIHYHSMKADGKGWSDRYAYLQKFTFDKDGEPVFGLPADPSLPMERPSGEVRIDKRKGVKKPSRTFNNPVYKGADPWVYKHDGMYYMCRSFRGGIGVSASEYLSDFTSGESIGASMKMVWKSSGDDRDWNARQVWAPEIHCIDGIWYIFYAAGRQSRGPFWEQRTGVLVSFDGPMGPYVEHDDKPLFTGDK